MRIETPDIYEDLKQRLMNAAFRPGDKLKPSELQGNYGCSANTIREILMRLANVGLVDFESQRGFRAAAVSQGELNDITMFRILLEQEGAVRSMRMGGVKWEADLNAAHHALVHIQNRIFRETEIRDNLNLWSEAERFFHETLISACGSKILRETYADVYLRFRQQILNIHREFHESYFATIIREHEGILAAALSRDEGACRTAIHAHLRRNIMDT